MAWGSANSKWWSTTITLAALAALSAFKVYTWRKKLRDLEHRIHDLGISVNTGLEKCAAERQGRIRAQQALRKAVAQQNSDGSKLTSYPMIPIAFVQSCFSTRNGTPRQPLLVPLTRACVVLDTPRIPPEALEGLAEYSHCWILYVFHLNTNLEKLWDQPSTSKFKAKVRVPRLKGGKMGVLATRSPHRPCPIGLTVAKVEAIYRNMILLSGVDLVDGTPVLDIKPYLPYSDNIQHATVPEWVMVHIFHIWSKEADSTGLSVFYMDNSLAVASIDFSPDFASSLASCWETMENQSLYSSPDELQGLIKQVLSWDIRSLSQRNRPHNSLLNKENDKRKNLMLELQECEFKADGILGKSEGGDITYHLILEGVDISYRIDSNSNLIVKKAAVSDVRNHAENRCNYMMWREIIGG